MRNLSFWLSKRLGKNNRSTGRTGSVIAVLGVALALAVMEITQSIAVGFKTEITTKLDGFVAPVTVSALDTQMGDHDSKAYIKDGVRNAILGVVPDSKMVGSIVMEGMLKTEENYAVAVLKAYETNYQSEFEKSNLIEGKWVNENDSRNIVISKRQATSLNIALNDKVNFCYFVRGKVKNRPMTVVGIYDSGFEDFDRMMVYTNYETLRNISHLDPGQITVLELRDIAVEDVPEVSTEIAREVELYAIMSNDSDVAYKIDNILEQGGQYISWLELLNTNVVVIFILMSVVALCTLISSLFIQVLDKVNTLGLLRALGAPNRKIGRVFQYISMRLVLKGILLGNIIGLGFILIQSKWNIISLNSEMYFLNKVPVSFDLFSILVLNLSVIIASWIVLYIPARIATKLSPAKTLRFD